MATKKQKEQLMATLKFTPRRYKVEIWGYGGEIYWGSVDRKIYDYFKANAIDIEQYASSWDYEMWKDIPDDLQPFPPGAGYECDHGCHISGATFDESTWITVYDENDNQVWQTNLDSVGLAKQGVEFECVAENYINDYDPGTVVFCGSSGEKGSFFSGGVDLTAPFDPKNIRLLYEDCDGWSIVSGIEYQGVDLESDDYGTNGKWSENKWIIVGGNEEVYEGIERDEESYEDNSDDDEEITLDEEWDPATELDKIEVPEVDSTFPIQDSDGEPMADPKGQWPF